ncbi:hypothetical protein QQZ08_004855 [Neonectria magnoliae]|uniref:Uncharacterized protein n=1 Tax=Neonectria magnoliae TaxID=2732573 RepID=A0ABR1I5W0_9HYPO
MVMISYPNGGPPGQPQAQGGPAASAANNGNVPATAGQNGHAFPHLSNMPHGGLGMVGHVMNNNNGFAGPQGQNHGFGAPQAMNNGFAAAQGQNAAFGDPNGMHAFMHFNNASTPLGNATSFIPQNVGQNGQVAPNMNGNMNGAMANVAGMNNNAAMANHNTNPGLVNFQNNNPGFAQPGNFQNNNPGFAQPGNQLRNNVQNNNPDLAQTGNELDNNFGNLAIAENQGASPAGNVVFDNANNQVQNQAGPVAPANIVFDNANHQVQNQAGAAVPANMNVNAVVADAQAQVNVPSPEFNFNDFGNFNLPDDAHLEIDMLFGDAPQAGPAPAADANGPAQFIFEDPENFDADIDVDDDDSESDEEQESDDEDDDMDAPGEVVAAPDGVNPGAAPVNTNLQVDPRIRMFVDQTGVQRLEIDTTHDLVQLLLYGPDMIDKANLSLLYARLAACFPSLGLTATNIPAGGAQVALPPGHADVQQMREAYLRAHPPGRDMDSRNDFLLQAREWQFTYRDIKELGNMCEAQSTLRGRHRTLLRAIAMVFTRRDIDLLRLAVFNLHQGQEPGKARATWRAIANWMWAAGSSIVFHPEAVKRKYALLRRQGRI